MAVAHLGFQSLNGNSRTALSSLKKFGLLDSNPGKIRVSELGLKIIHPKNAEEKSNAIQEALQNPRIFQTLLSDFPDWELPSDQTLISRLVRDYKFLPTAAKSFVETLKKSVSYAAQNVTEIISQENDEPEASSIDRRESMQPQAVEPARRAPSQSRAEIALPAPHAYLEVPAKLTQAEKQKIVRWLDQVVKNWLEFVVEDEEPPSDPVPRSRDAKGDRTDKNDAVPLLFEE